MGTSVYILNQLKLIDKSRRTVVQPRLKMFKLAALRNGHCRHLKRNLSYVAQIRLLQKLKEDQGFCREQMATGQFLLYSKGKPLLAKNMTGEMLPLWISTLESSLLESDLVQNSVVLGVTAAGVAQYALNVDESVDLKSVEVQHGGKFTDLRVGLFMVDSPTAHTLSRGWSLLQWKKTQNFCAKCGSPLAKSLSGSQASCSSPNCTSVYYPSTSPVGIVSISDAQEDKLLLIRQPRYPPGMYSCIAGFLDVGETLEDCVRREAAEEVGIQVEQVTYVGSQHWPFPAGSLMIGCQAEALAGQKPDPCKVELEDARWFTRQEVREAFERIAKNPMLRISKNNNPDEIFIAPRGAIANFLVKTWLSNPNK